MIQAVLFDMDGTMFNTEILWGDVTRKLAQQYEIVFDEQVRVQMMGKKDAEALAIMRDHFNITATVEELIENRRKLILEDTSLVQINAGLLELLNLLEKLHIKKAVATSSFREFTNKLLAQFELTHRFEAVITGDDVTKSKPDPEMFLFAASKLGVEPVKCLVLEDAQNGVEAAHNAGMAVFAIPHDASRHHDFSKATKVLNSLEEVNEQILLQI